jgi:hypothetical protein
MHCVVDWISNLPVPVAVLLALAGGGAVSAIGLLGLNRILPHPIRSTHNDVSGFILAIVGVIYAVLLAFIAVAVWQNFAQVDNLVLTEANLVGDLYRDTAALPDPTASALRDSVFVYAEVVVQDEWPGLAAGRTDDAAGWQLLDRFHSELVEFHSTDPGVSYMQADMVRTLNQLYDARRGRFHAAIATLPAILWWNLLVGAVILMLFTYLFGVPHLLMHVSMVSLLGALIGLVLLLIVLLSNPFRGRSHVSVEPFNHLVRSVETMSYPH